MDDDKNQFPLERQLFKHRDNILRIVRRKPRSRLVQNQYRWFANQFQRNVQPLSLAATYFFVQRAADFQVFDPKKSKRPEHLRNFNVDLGLGEVVKTQLRTVIQVLIDC